MACKFGFTSIFAQLKVPVVEVVVSGVVVVTVVLVVDSGVVVVTVVPGRKRLCQVIKLYSFSFETRSIPLNSHYSMSSDEHTITVKLTICVIETDSLHALPALGIGIGLYL